MCSFYLHCNNNNNADEKQDYNDPINARLIFIVDHSNILRFAAHSHVSPVDVISKIIQYIYKIKCYQLPWVAFGEVFTIVHIHFVTYGLSNIFLPRYDFG